MLHTTLYLRKCPFIFLLCVCVFIEIILFRYMPYEILWSFFMGCFKDFFFFYCFAFDPSYQPVYTEALSQILFDNCIFNLLFMWDLSLLLIWDRDSHVQLLISVVYDKTQTSPHFTSSGNRMGWEPICLPGFPLFWRWALISRPCGMVHIFKPFEERTDKAAHSELRLGGDLSETLLKCFSTHNQL